PRGAEGFVLLPRRWVVERSFAWFGRNRRLYKDCERLIKTARACLYIASISMLLRRCATYCKP
ncbi:MAG: transposase, partial [Pseudomonadota bacterium]